MPELSFEPEGHIYRVDGRVVPSVTQILEPLQYLEGIPWDVLEAAREFGNHVHSACDLWNRGELDVESLDSALLPYLIGWQAFLARTGFQITASEARVYHPQYHYAGTADTFGVWQGSSWVLDLKSGAVPATVGAQLAAYQAAARPKPRRRLCVQLTGNGDYRTHECKDPADWSLFLSALNLHQFRHKRKPAHVDYAA